MKRVIQALAATIVAAVLLGCGPAPAGEKGTAIVDAATALELLADGNAVLVDANKAVTYQKRHAEGAVNIPRPAIVVNEPVPNLLAPASQIEQVMGEAGIGNETLVLAYDDNKNMDAARLWFTLKAYGHDDVKVISGGLNALAAAGAAVTTDVPSPSPASFSAAPLNSDMLITSREVRDRSEDPPANYALIDTRSLEEFTEGTIPGAVCLDFSGNNFSDGTYKPVNQIRIRYLEQKIDYDDEVVMFCKTSIRGAQTYLALYNAGYRNLKLYDGAWVEWTANPMNPIYVPEGAELNLNAADQS
jgi:thiosulfate/3-mercaptopyruvate sulfurtransferase